MEIKFTIEVDVDADDYKELYTADVIMEDGTSFTVRASEDDTTYDAFRSDIFEDLFMSLAEATGLTINVEEEDYANIDLEDFLDEVDGYPVDIEEYLDNLDSTGC